MWWISTSTAAIAALRRYTSSRETIERERSKGLAIIVSLYC